MLGDEGSRGQGYVDDLIDALYIGINAHATERQTSEGGRV